MELESEFLDFDSWRLVELESECLNSDSDNFGLETVGLDFDSEIFEVESDLECLE